MAPEDDLGETLARLRTEIAKRRSSIGDILFETLDREDTSRSLAQSKARTRRILDIAKDFPHGSGNRADPSPAGAVRRFFPKRLPDPGRRPRVAGVMDDFTARCFAPECDYLPLHPAGYKKQLADFMPELIFVESAWSGSDGLWHRKVRPGSASLEGLLRLARSMDIPTVFWNKEDPVHFDLYLELAPLFDAVFTTDLDCIPAYKARVGHDRVFFLPFAAQPALHDPIETIPRKNRASFAGSYYMRYPERRHDFETVVGAVSDAGPVDIFDRNLEKDDPSHEFPQAYAGMIVGSLPFSEISTAYKGYDYGINVNTVKQSQSMFARRVYELIASNTIVIGNFSRGLRLLLGDLVVSSDDPGYLRRRFDEIASDPVGRRKLRLRALRKVMREHTYGARLDYILEKMFLDTSPKPGPRVAVVARVASRREGEALLQTWRRQTCGNRRLILIDGRGLSGPTLPSSAVVVGDIAEALAGIAAFAPDFIGGFVPEDHYGPNYLTDLVLSDVYAHADGAGKHARFVASTPGPLRMDHEGETYRAVGQLEWRCSIFRTARIGEDTLRRFLSDPAGATHAGEGLLALDEFNYCRSGAVLDDARRASVNDAPTVDEGLPLDDLYGFSEGLAAARPAARPAARASLTAEEFHADTVVPKGARLSTEAKDGRLFATSTNDSGIRVQIFMQRKIPRGELNLIEHNTLRFDMDHTLDQARLLCEFYDTGGKRVDYTMLRQSGTHFLSIPPDCTHLRFGLHLLGTGAASMGEIVFGRDPVMPQAVAGQAKALLLTSRYPSYDDPGANAAIHERVLACRRAGIGIDVFQFGATANKPYREFEGVDVARVDGDLLRATLDDREHSRILMNGIDRRIWTAVKPSLSGVRTGIWMHGETIRRPIFGFSDWSELWREIFDGAGPDRHLIFPSEDFLEDMSHAIGMRPGEDAFSIESDPSGADDFRRWAGGRDDVPFSDPPSGPDRPLFRPTSPA